MATCLIRIYLVVNLCKYVVEILLMRERKKVVPCLLKAYITG